MKRQWILIGVSLLAGISLGVNTARGELEVAAEVEIHSHADFYEPLAPHGTWVEVGSYGRCWRPSHVAVGWRPYCDGYWVWTDCGWYWVSDEPWAWACYHYGRWTYESNAWLWIPDPVWGPAWVSWREGGGYCGWAPLSPRARFRGEVIVEVDVPPASFVFVETRRFHDHFSPSTVIVNDTKIVNKTVNITKIKQVNKTIVNEGPRKVVVNEGPAIENIEKATGKKVQAEPIRNVAEKTPAPPAVKRKEIRKEEKREKVTPAPKPEEKAAPSPQEKPVPREKVVPPPQEKAEPKEKAEPRREKPEPREKAAPPPEEKEERKGKVEPQEKEPKEKAEPRREKAEPREKPERREKAEPAPETPREKPSEEHPSRNEHQGEGRDKE